MIKTLLFGLNVFGFLLIGFFQKSEVTISHTPPSSLKPGQEAVITVNIDKSNVTGFAKYQITLGDGLTAEVVESAGASFTFNDQKAKFIWMALPDAKKFTIKYRIIADKNALGNLNLDSRFSYIYQNERKNYDLADHLVTVGDPGALAANQIKSSLQEKASNNAAVVTTDRLVTSVGINQWKVDVSIQKSGLQGFAKIEENIPNGYTVIDLKSSNAIFSLDDAKVKYIWYDFPESDIVTISYKMLPVIAMDAATPKIEGYFSYLKGEETVTIPIGDAIEEIEIEEEEEILAANPDTASAIINDTTTSEIVEEIAEVVDPAKNEDTSSETTTEKSNVPPVKPEEKPEPKPVQKAKPETKQSDDQNAIADNSTTKGRTDANIVNVPEPETGVYYRVQIAAGKNNLKSDVFTKLYGFSEGYKLENEDGLYKYTTGYHQVYKSARDGRERITAKYEKFKGPFVTAYNDGERITVQEALMITSQKWFQ